MNRHVPRIAPRTRRLDFETLESRMLLSADLLPVAPLPEPEAPRAAEFRDVTAATLATTPEVRFATEAPRELVIVDGGIANASALVEEWSARGFEVIALDPSRDAIDQIGELLDARRGLAAVHLVSHGRDGALVLGNDAWDAAALSTRATDVARWADAFAPEGDLLLYACDLAVDASGRAFAERLALLTGADVAASADATGDALLGGDWTLEYASGAIDARALDATGWSGLLAAYTLDWDTVGAAWALPTGTNAIGVGGQDVLVTVGGTAGGLGALDAGYPQITVSNTGGLTDPGTNAVLNEQSLALDTSGIPLGDVITVTFDFSSFGTVSNVRFLLFDIDTAGNGTTFVDQITVTANGGTLNPTGIVNGPAANLAAGYGTPLVEGPAPQDGPYNVVTGGNTITGDTTVEDNSPGDRANGNAWIDFNAAGITAITIEYRNARGASAQGISVHDLRFEASAPTITSNGGGPSASISVAENTSAVTTVTATDPDAPPSLAYSIVGGADSAFFAIDASTGALSFITARNFDAPADAGGDNVYDVRVRASDGTFFDEQDIAVAITAVNDNTPVITSNGGGATAAVSIAENTNTVTTVTATDADLPAQTLTYSIVGGADSAFFAINASTGVLAFLTARDFEAPADAGGNNVYDVRVQVSDGTLVDVQDIAVTVTALNDNTPVISSNGGGATAAVSIAENATAITTVTATDADLPAQTLTYSIVGGADSAFFTINGSSGALSFITGRDFEAPADAGGNNVYDVRVQVSDGTLVDVQDVAVTVTALNDNTPVITSNGAGATAAVSIAENTTTVTTVTAADADLPAQTLNYSIVGGADSAFFTINASTGVLAFLTARDFEAPADAGGNNVYDVRVRVSDGALADTQDIAVTVTAVNDNNPVITSNGGGATAAVSIAENTTTVTTVTATDADLPAQTLTYSIVGGADSAFFTINASSGVLSFITGRDFEAPADAGGNNVYDVRVQVSDGTFSDVQDIAVTILPVNDNAPVITSGGGGATASVAAAENGTGVAVITATDADLPAQSLAYLIVGGADAAFFVLDGNTGALTFATPRDFEAPADANADNVYEVVVRASDGTFADDQALAVTVTNVNETPVITSAGGGPAGVAAAPENTTMVTTVTASDVDVPTTLTFLIAGGADAARFAVDALTGALTFIAPPDFEAPADANADNVYEVIVRASDGALFDDQTLAVNVTAVNDPPGIAAPGTLGVTEDVASAIDGIVFTDPDAASGAMTATLQVASGSLAASAGGGVTVSGAGSGTLVLGGSLADLNAFVAGGNVTFTTSTNAVAPVTLAITIDDNGNSGAGTAHSTATTATLLVAAVNDAPTVAAPVAPSVTEDVASALTGVVLADVDAGVAPVTVTFGVASGTLAAMSGGGVTAMGSGSASLALVGSIGNINAFIAGGAVTFTTAANATANVPLTITIDDGGNTGSGGPRTASAAGTLIVVPINDAPRIAGDLALLVLEGGVVTIAPTDLAGLDVDDAGAGLVYEVLTAPSYGRLEFVDAPGLAITTFTQADLDAGRVRYVHDGSETTADGFTLRLADGGEDGAAPDVDTLNVVVVPVNDAPSLTTGSGAVDEGSMRLVVTTGLISAFDPDDDIGLLTFTLDAVFGGYMELAGAQGAPIASFTGAQLRAGVVQFVQADAAVTPAIRVSVTDGQATDGPRVVVLTLRQVGVASPMMGIADTAPTGITVLAPFRSEARPAELRAPLTQGFLREPTLPQAPPVVAEPEPSGNLAPRPRLADAAVESPRIEVAAVGLRFSPPAPGEVSIPRIDFSFDPMRHDIALSDSQETVLGLEPSDAARVAGLALTAGAVWWIFRMGSLIGSALVSAPAWRHIDPLPVLGGGGRERVEWDAPDDDPQDEATEAGERFFDQSADAPKSPHV
jgi:hypothetical protein